MRIYEEYESNAEKRKAQRGAKRGVATGKARGYLFIFEEDGKHWSGHTMVYSGAFGELLDVGQGPGAGPESITSVNPSDDHLRNKCRRVGFETIPDAWKRAFAAKLDDCLDESIPELKKQRKRYGRIIRQYAQATTV